jgi:hypothetical protein
VPTASDAREQSRNALLLRVFGETVMPIRAGARELSAYIAAAVPLTTLRDELLAARADRDEDVRRAAGWALAHLGS